jgi:hypothetical protein
LTGGSRQELTDGELTGGSRQELTDGELTGGSRQELTNGELTGCSRQELTDGADKLTKELTDGPRQDMKDEVPDKYNRLSQTGVDRWPYRESKSGDNGY